MYKKYVLGGWLFGLLVGMCSVQAHAAEEFTADMAASGEVAVNEANFPDAAFRKYVSDTCDENKDGILSEAEIGQIQVMYVCGKGISSLKGMEYFTALESLDCSDNQLRSLDVSKNAALVWLYCSDNLLSALNVNGNAALQSLSCYDNQLNSLDISNNKKLDSLTCGDNQLKYLDIRGNKLLKMLDCYNNQLSSLDVSGNLVLESLNCAGNLLGSLDVSGNQALEYLDCAGNQLSSLKTEHLDGLRDLWCQNNRLSSLDLSGNTALKTLVCYDNQLNSLKVSDSGSLKILNCDNNCLTALDVSKNTALKTLYCSDNLLSQLDVGRNTVLEELSCSGNRLGSLDVSANTALNDFACSNNQIKTLDVSKNTALRYLYCSGNQLSCLDLSQNTALGNFSSDQYIHINSNQIDMRQYDAAFDAAKVLELSDLTLEGTVCKISKDYFMGSYVYDCGNANKMTVYMEQTEDGETPQPDVPQPDKNFTDVSPEAYYAAPVQWAVKKGITTGTGHTTFSPEKFCTRSQIVTFLWRAAGCPEPKSANNPFTDVKASAYYYKAVLWAVEQGITSGTSATTFSPEKVCTRGQAVTFIYRYEGKPDMNAAANPFTDVAGGQYYYQPVLWAVKRGITNGTGATAFSPQKNCTRGQIVTFLYRNEN